MVPASPSNSGHPFRPVSSPSLPSVGRTLVPEAKLLAQFLASDKRFKVSSAEVPTLLEEAAAKGMALGDLLLKQGKIVDTTTPIKEIVEELNARQVVEKILRENPKLIGRVAYDEVGGNRSFTQDLEKLANWDDTWKQAGVIPAGLITKPGIGGQTSSVLYMVVKDSSFLHQTSELEFAIGSVGRGCEMAFLVTKESAYNFLYTKRFKGSSAFKLNTNFPDAGMSVDKIKETAPIVQLCEQIIFDAIASKASDISLEPIDGALRVRLRVNGVWAVYNRYETALLAPVMSRLKIMANMKIDEKRLAQDGRIEVQFEGRPIDIRAAAIPCSGGEGITLRLLDREQGLKSPDQLGMERSDQALLNRFISKRGGILFISGPTGSGKTTTLYSLLSGLDTEKLKVLTAESPIEYQLPGIIQVPVGTDPQRGMTFDTALQAMMRHAPDIILVGEIRDKATAEAAEYAARSGHLVLATTHATSAAEAFDRLASLSSPVKSEHDGLRDMFMAITIASISQRLVRELCESCKVPDSTAAARLAELDLHLPEGETPDVSMQGRGCKDCNYKGHTGRIGIFEILEIVEDSKGKRLPKSDFRHLSQDGLAKVLRGRVALEEVEHWVRNLDELRGLSLL